MEPKPWPNSCWIHSDLDAADLLFHQQMKAQLHAVLDTLEAREARVIAMRFGMTGGEAQTLDAVAKTYGMTRERIRQIEVAAMEKLKDPSRSNVLRQYQFDCESPSGGERCVGIRAGGPQARCSRHASDTTNTTAPSPSMTNTMSPQFAWVTPVP